MSKPTKTNSLEIISQAQMSTKWTIGDLAKQARQELESISQMESVAAIRALRFGILMHHVKATLPRGQFRQWQLDTFPGIKKSQCNYYMRLTMVFIESMRLNKAEVLALPEAQLELALDKQTETSARSVLEKVAKFVGTHSLTDLLIKHDIKSVGLKKELGEGDEEDEDLALPLEDQIRIRRERIFGKTSEHFTHLRKLFTKPEDVQLLDKTQIETIRADIAEITKALEAARAA